VNFTYQCFIGFLSENRDVTTNNQNSKPKKSFRQSINGQRLLTSLGIALGLVMIIFGFQASRTGRDESGMRYVIDRM
jgi:hypothetical protein